MAEVTIDKAVEMAVALHVQGRLGEAEDLYRRITAVDPCQASALNGLGLLAHQRGDENLAIAFLEQVRKLCPDNAELLLNLGEAYRQRGDVEKAIAVARRAAQLVPSSAEAYSNLGLALTEAGGIDEAIRVFQQALALMGARIAQAPQRQAEILAHAAPLLTNLGNALRMKGRLGEALACYDQALAHAPQKAASHAARSGVLQEWCRLDEAVAAAQRALALDGRLMEAHNNLAVALAASGRAGESVACFDAALALNPRRADIASNRLFTLQYLPGTTAAQMRSEARAWGRHYADPIAPLPPAPRDGARDRRLRIGYVSADFRLHAAASFVLPLLAHHDASRVEVICYSTAQKPDAITEQLRRLAPRWHDASQSSDESLAHQIRRDGVDILVDLSLHSRGNRLLAFARRPAPVQMSWLGYAGITGMAAIDYRIADRWLDPVDQAEEFEKPVRLAHCFWCYRPLVDTPDVGPLPALERAGRVTFGCLNNFAKVNELTLGLWWEILHRVERSELLLNCSAESAQQRVRAHAAAAGIAADRLRFWRHGSIASYYAQHRAIDVALDTYPFGGGTTTCDALWMGVPVVTLAGRELAVSRAGASILNNAGSAELLELIADEPGAYVAAAVNLAGDLPRLARLRAALRPAMQAAPLMDGNAFAADMERIFREVWDVKARAL